MGRVRPTLFRLRAAVVSCGNSRELWGAAGSLPFDMRFQHPGDPYHDVGDFEQLRARGIYNVTDYTGMYALAALEPGRQQ